MATPPVPASIGHQAQPIRQRPRILPDDFAPLFVNKPAVSPGPLLNNWFRGLDGRPVPKAGRFGKEQASGLIWRNVDRWLLGFVGYRKVFISFIDEQATCYYTISTRPGARFRE